MLLTGVYSLYSFWLFSLFGDGILKNEFQIKTLLFVGLVMIAALKNFNSGAAPLYSDKIFIPAGFKN